MRWFMRMSKLIEGSTSPLPMHDYFVAEPHADGSAQARAYTDVFSWRNGEDVAIVDAAPEQAAPKSRTLQCRSSAAAYSHADCKSPYGSDEEDAVVYMQEEDQHTLFECPRLAQFLRTFQADEAIEQLGIREYWWMYDRMYEPAWCLLEAAKISLNQLVCMANRHNRASRERAKGVK